jgi:hypothetical protein
VPCFFFCSAISSSRLIPSFFSTTSCSPFILIAPAASFGIKTVVGNCKSRVKRREAGKARWQRWAPIGRRIRRGVLPGGGQTIEQRGAKPSSLGCSGPWLHGYLAGLVQMPMFPVWFMSLLSQTNPGRYGSA